VGLRGLNTGFRKLATGLGGSGGAAPTPWSPGDLPGLQPSLQVALSLSQGGLWQDAGKTVPATEDGDPVRVATCPWTGQDYVAPSDSARPLLWDEGGGKWSLFFDGIDDRMAFPGLTLADYLLYFAQQTVGDCGLVSKFSQNYQVRIGSPVGRLYLLDGVVDMVSDALTTDRADFSVIGYERSGTAVAFFENLSARGTGVMSSPLLLDNIGTLVGGANPTNGRIAGFIPAAAAPSADNRTLLTAYLTALYPPA